MVPSMVRRAARRDGARHRRVVACLAVLAVVAQAVLFDFAMAARATTAAQERAAAAHSPGHHHTPPHKPDNPGHGHEGTECPFCIARATHQAAPVANAVVPLLVTWLVAAAAPFAHNRVRAVRRPRRFRSRSPPTAPRHRLRID